MLEDAHHAIDSSARTMYYISFLHSGRYFKSSTYIVIEHGDQLSVERRVYNNIYNIILKRGARQFLFNSWIKRTWSRLSPRPGIVHRRDIVNTAEDQRLFLYREPQKQYNKYVSCCKLWTYIVCMYRSQISDLNQVRLFKLLQKLKGRFTQCAYTLLPFLLVPLGATPSSFFPSFLICIKVALRLILSHCSQSASSICTWMMNTNGNHRRCTSIE